MTRWELPPLAHHFAVVAVPPDQTPITLKLTSRSISVDESGLESHAAVSAGADELDSLLQADAWICEMVSADEAPELVTPHYWDPSRLVWHHGSLKHFPNVHRVDASHVQAVLSEAWMRNLPVPLVFLRAGRATFRMCAVHLGAPPAAATAQHGTGQDDVACGELAVAPSPHRRAKDKYTSAVAYEFVTNVISKVLGDHENDA